MQREGMTDVPKIISVCRNLCEKRLERLFDFYVKKIQSLCYSCKSFCLYFKRGKTPRIEEKKMCVSRSTATKHMNLFFMTNRFFDL